MYQNVSDLISVVKDLEQRGTTKVVLLALAERGLDRADTARVCPQEQHPSRKPALAGRA
ncbi:hypothetical protein D3C86_2191200 [compost metagenome]